MATERHCKQPCVSQKDGKCTNDCVLMALHEVVLLREGYMDVTQELAAANSKIEELHKCLIHDGETLGEYQQQIEKMKCCGNCKSISHRSVGYIEVPICQLSAADVLANNICRMWEQQ